MNPLSEQILALKNGQTIELEKGKEYHFYQDDCIVQKGYFCSNTASKQENPDGLRYIALFLKDKKNICIKGNGAKIIIHGVMTPILVDKCKNVVVENLEIDYARPTMSEFTILQREEGQAIIEVAPIYNYKIQDNQLIWLGEQSSSGERFWQHPYKGQNILSTLFNPQNNRIRYFNEGKDDGEVFVPTFEKIERINQYKLRVYLKDKDADFPQGHVVQTRSTIRNQVGSFFVNCKNIALKKLRVKFMHGLGLLFQNCQHITLDGVDATPAQDRTIASNADFFHFSGCLGKIAIVNCKAYGAHDDFINIHGTHLRIIKKIEDNGVLLRFMHSQSWGFDAFCVNDKIEFIKWDTLLPYCRAKIKKVEKINDTDVVLYLNKKISGVEFEKDVVENVTRTPKAYIANNYFGTSSGRGVLCTTRKKVVIENNYFYHNAGATLVVEDDCNFWFESGKGGCVIFRNNTVNDCGYGSQFNVYGDKNLLIKYSPKVLNKDFEGVVHDNLKVVGNTFISSNNSGYKMQFNYLKSAVIKNNKANFSFKIERHNLKKLIYKDNYLIKKI